MPETVTFVVPGLARGQGRPNFARIGKGVRTYDSADDIDAKDKIGFYFRQAAPNHALWHGPTTIEICCSFPWPKSWPKWKREWAATGPRVYVGKPDASNILKSVEDALGSHKRQIAMKDDTQVIPIGVYRRYVIAEDEPPAMTVTLVHHPEWLPVKPTEKRR